MTIDECDVTPERRRTPCTSNGLKGARGLGSSFIPLPMAADREGAGGKSTSTIGDDSSPLIILAKR